MHLHSLVALTLAATTSALPSLPECLMNEEHQPRACREVGPAQSKLDIITKGQKQQNRGGGLHGQIELVDQQINKEIECPECGKNNFVGDLAQSGSIEHNNIVTGHGEQQLDIINNGKTYEEWTGSGQKKRDVMPHGQKANFNNFGQNQKRNQHIGQQLYNGQSNSHGSININTGKTQQDELFNKGQGINQELYNGIGQNNGRIQERDNTHQWGNQLFQGQNQERSEQFITGQGQNHQQEQFNKGTRQIEGLYSSGSNANGIIQDFNKGGQGQGIQQLNNGQNQLYRISQDGILIPINNHQQEQFNKGQQTQQLNNIGQQAQEQFNKGQQTQEQFNKGQTNNIQARDHIAEQQFTDGQNKQHQQIDGGQNHQGQLSAGPVMSKPINEEWTIQGGKTQEQIDGQNEQGQQWTKNGGGQEELFNGQSSQHLQEHIVFSPQQMLDFISSQTKTGQTQQKWVREQVVRDGKLTAVWSCVN
ncbi:hypothetical protein B0T20DRAFT_395598 [Sordaria brevicollis]|uniref:Uncharacterized protein n=1 Tax=Sordaria brevicollis TaxID=83679 RepID=A0AAE0P9A3_SORBR|nr:hypothetical protein B0T20DRAFT_395598 [Sordaria brevicollis]